MAKKKQLRRWQRLLRLIQSNLDPRAYLHLFKIINYYNYSHVAPLRKIHKGINVSISPTVCFSNPERIRLGNRVRIGENCILWAGPSSGRIIVGDDALLGPNVLLTAANYRFDDGSPVNDQMMDEADVILGRDVWLGAGVMVMPGVKIGDFAVVGAGAVVTKNQPERAVVVGVPARQVGERQLEASK